MGKFTICAGIVCYNEIEWIEACVKGALEGSDLVVITDGLYIPNRGVDSGDLKLASNVMHSHDGTWEFLRQMAREEDRILLFNLDEDMPLETEIVVRDMQLQLCQQDYFLIIDADEVWHKNSWANLEQALIEDKGRTDNWYLTNSLYWHSPHYYFATKHMRLFKMDRERHFTGINEIEPHSNEKISNIGFYHYGYIDPIKVLFKMQQRYTQGSYQGCGEWWFENIFMKFNGMNTQELVEKNFDTLHPWGKIHPGFAKEEWALKQKIVAEHPASMKPYFQSRNFDLSNIVFI